MMVNQSLKKFGGVVTEASRDLSKQFYKLSYKQHVVYLMTVSMTLMISITLGCATAKPPHAVPPVYQPPQAKAVTSMATVDIKPVDSKNIHSLKNSNANHVQNDAKNTAENGIKNNINDSVNNDVNNDTQKTVQNSLQNKTQNEIHNSQDLQQAVTSALTDKQAAYDMNGSVTAGLPDSSKTASLLQSHLIDDNSTQITSQKPPLRQTNNDISAALLKNARQHSGRQTIANAHASYAKEELPAFRYLLNQGIQQLKNDQLSAAQDSFTQAQRIAPQSSKVYFYLSKIALNKQQPTKAEAMARRGLLVANNREAKFALWQIILTSGEMRDNVSSMNEAKSALALLGQ